MDAYLGMVVLFAFDYAPQNWLPCEGQLLPVEKNQALYAVIGNKFEGQITFTRDGFLHLRDGHLAGEALAFA